MARPLRIEYPGAVYHITSRGNEKKLIFKDERDREIFLDTLSQVDKRYNWLCHAYCLMNNHYHLITETPDGNLSAGMRQLNGVYTQAFNRQHNRVGHLFQGRYKAILIQKDSHLLEVCRFVVLNPVGAKSILGEEQVTATLTNYLRGKKDIAELPKSQRYIDRPSLQKIFSKNILKDVSKRNRTISEAVRRHGYRQREVADYLEMHFTSISRILRERGKC